MLDFGYVILFCVLFYSLELAMVWATVKDAAGLWHSDRFRPLIGAIVNLVLNIIFVKYIGLYGIILSTVFSYVFISMPWLVHNLFKYLYKTSSLKAYIKDLVGYILVTVISTAIVIVICGKIFVGGITGLLLKCLVCVVVPLFVQITMYKNKDEFKESLFLVKNMLKRG